jgi:hypothetical protein
MKSKVALISEGAVQVCSRSRAIRILRGKEEFKPEVFTTVEHLCDLDDEEKRLKAIEIEKRVVF